MASQLHDGRLLAWHKLAAAAAAAEQTSQLPLVVAHHPVREETSFFVVDLVLVVALDGQDEVALDAAAALDVVVLDVAVAVQDEGDTGMADLDVAGLDAAAGQAVGLEPVLLRQAEERGPELAVAF